MRPSRPLKSMPNQTIDPRMATTAAMACQPGLLLRACGERGRGLLGEAR